MAGSIKELFQGFVLQGMPRIEKAVVAETDPIRMVLVDDPKINLSAASLIIPYGTREELQTGRRFWLLSFGNNNIFYILDRAEE